MGYFPLPIYLGNLTATASLLLVFSASTAGQDWPLFGRNATRNAVVADGKGPTDWDVVSGVTSIGESAWVRRRTLLRLLQEGRSTSAPTTERGT